MYDTIIIGAGSAGLPASIYSARYGMKTLVISRDIGGLLATTTEVENYPGYEKITGPELMEKFENQAKKLGVEIRLEDVKEIKKSQKHFEITTESSKYDAKTVILAVGLKPRRLDAKGDDRFYGKGVSYCATCDGAFSRGKVVGIIGGGDSAVHGAHVISNFAEKVYLFVRRDEFRADPFNVKKITDDPKIEIRYNTQVEEIYGDKKVEGIRLKSGEDLPLKMLFVEIGHVAPKEFLDKIGLKTDENGLVIIDKFCKTNIEGFFACGDITNIPLKQTIVAAGYGACAALSAFEYVKRLEE